MFSGKWGCQASTDQQLFGVVVCWRCFSLWWIVYQNFWLYLIVIGYNQSNNVQQLHSINFEGWLKFIARRRLRLFQKIVPTDREKNHFCLRMGQFYSCLLEQKFWILWIMKKIIQKLRRYQLLRKQQFSRSNEAEEALIWLNKNLSFNKVAIWGPNNS